MNTKYTREHVNSYIQSKQLAWAPSTIKSEAARLHAALDLINKGPHALYDEGVERYKLYALKTLYIRAGELEKYVFGTETFKSFMQTNARLFKNAYQKEVVSIDYKQASLLVDKIEDSVARKAARLILNTGLRSREALSYDGSGFIIGKGSKERAVLSEDCLTENERASLTYSVFHKALAKVGLKPHTLRKLVATQLVDVGAKEADLLKIMGWSSILTASSYLQPKSDNKLKALMKEALHNGN